jgi:hypothetical protein
MLAAQMVKDCAIQGGADICGIADVERFRDGPPETHPNSLFPEARSVIVCASRILKGSYKGIQEGTDWSTYWIHGYGSCGRRSNSVTGAAENCGTHRILPRTCGASNALPTVACCGPSWISAWTRAGGSSHRWPR